MEWKGRRCESEEAGLQHDKLAVSVMLMMLIVEVKRANSRFIDRISEETKLIELRLMRI